MARAHPRIARQETAVDLGGGRRVLLGEEIGSGSTASVLRASLELPFGLAKPVAFKVFDALAGDERDGVVETIAHAARALARVRHPNVVEVHEFGLLPGGRPYLLEELVDGPSLGALAQGYEARKLRAPLDLALFVGVEIAEALAGARAASADGARRGLAHGDLTTREVLLSRHGEVKVADLGIASASRAASSVRSFTHIARRAAFLAPEIVGGEQPSARADVFSLAVILWELLVGPRFPAAATDADRLAMAREGLVHTTVFDPHLPGPVKLLLRRALDPSPEQRYPHAGALAFELRRVAFGLGVGDGRVFLRHALQRLRDDEVEAEEAITKERIQAISEAPAPTLAKPTPTPPTSGTIRRAPARDGDP